MQQQQLQAFSGLRYDRDTQTADLRQSVGPGGYLLGTPIPHCEPCLAADTRIHVGTSGVNMCQNVSLIDVDSELHGITRRATRAPNGLYHPTPACTSVNEATCRTMPNEDTRLVNPPCTLRGTGWNRWEWLCTNPQERALLSFDTLIDTSLVVKDNHRPVLPEPIDPTLALPPGKNDPPKKGAPQWIPKCPPEYTSPLPTVHWRQCQEIEQIQRGCSSYVRA